MTETMPFAPMEAKSVTGLPAGDNWQFEPKWDGFRCLAVKTADGVSLFGKSGKPLHRFFPEVAQNVAAIAGEFVIDGEMVIPIAGHGLSFDALQMRLHPAESRIRRLAREIPALFVAFDLVRIEGRDLGAEPLTSRRTALEALLATRYAGMRLSPFTRERSDAEQWLGDAGGPVDGVICKKADGPYVFGERAMLKVKRIRTADCVVGGFRYGTGTRLVGSLLLGLYDDAGRLDHIGFTSAFAGVDKRAMTEKLEALRGEGFTGNAPGGPSRWSTERTAEYFPLRPELVVEVTYDHFTGGRFRHGTTIVRWRPDKAPGQCTYEQIRPPAEPPAAFRDIVGPTRP
jgi:ATP-dependent DNA ligase